IDARAKVEGRVRKARAARDAVGAGQRRPRHLRRVRRAPLAARFESAGRVGPLVAAARAAREASRLHRADREAVSAPVRHRLPRPARERAAEPALARAAPGLPAARSARGEIRGGRFAQAFSGEQFALPEAVDALRAVRRLPKEGERVSLSACDPLNFAGILTPGARIPAQPQNRVVYVDGVPQETEARVA